MPRVQSPGIGGAPTPRATWNKRLFLSRARSGQIDPCGSRLLSPQMLCGRELGLSASAVGGDHGHSASTRTIAESCVQGAGPGARETGALSSRGGGPLWETRVGGEETRAEWGLQRH